MLTDRTALKIIMILAILSMTSCRSKKEITKQKEKQVTKTEIAETKRTEIKQEAQTRNQIIASTDENSQLTIIRYDTEKPVTANGLPPVLEVIHYNKTTKAKTNQEQSTQNKIEERSDYKSETKTKIQTEQRTKTEKGEKPFKAKIPLPFWFIIFATATGATIILIRKSKSKLAMGIANGIRRFLNLLRKK